MLLIISVFLLFVKEKKRRRLLPPPPGFNACGRTCSRCTDPWRDWSHGCPPGCCPESSNLRCRNGMRRTGRCIRCTCLPFRSCCFPPFCEITASMPRSFQVMRIKKAPFQAPNRFIITKTKNQCQFAHFTIFCADFDEISHIALYKNLCYCIDTRNLPLRLFKYREAQVDGEKRNGTKGCNRP